jgi:hypothetical protein
MGRTSSFTLGFLALLLGGCMTLHPVDNGQDKTNEMSDWDWFSVQSLQEFKEHIVRDDGSVALTTYDTAITKREDSDFSVHLYPSLSSPCSPSLTGASQTEQLKTANGKAEWGRVNYRDGYGSEGWTYPYDPKNILCKIQGTPPPAQVYALCSEKDDKTVVICISQMKDNPQQAKEIFETFRWTK